VVASLSVLLAMSVAPAARAESIGPGTLEKLGEVAVWANRNSPDPTLGVCGVVCKRLWESEHGLLGGSFAGEEAYEEWGWTAIDIGVWSPLGELSSQLGSRGIAEGNYTVGWLMGGPELKFMALAQPGPGNAPELRWCDSMGNYTFKLLAPGEGYGYEGAVIAERWLYAAGQEYCPFGGIGYYSKFSSPGCNTSVTAPPAWPGWQSDEAAMGVCEPEGDPEIDALRTRPFKFGLIENYAGQSANWMFETHEPPEQSLAVLEELLKSQLESPRNLKLREWIEYIVTGVGFNPVGVPAASEDYGTSSEGASSTSHCEKGDPVNCFTGNESESQTDLSVGGRGVPLVLDRTYNSQAAAAGVKGSFGYGWSASFSDSLEINAGAGTVTVRQANGSTLAFEGKLSEPGPLLSPAWVQATLVLKSDGTYLYTLPDQESLHFSSAGRLLGVSERNGNETTLSYSSEGRLEAVTAASGHKLTFTYNPQGFVESVKDPMGHTVKYAYEGGQLASVTLPGESSPRWRFKYDESHQLDEMIDGRGGKTLTEYDGSHRVIAQTDPLGRKTSWEYGEGEPFVTTITNHTTGTVAKEYFNGAGELTSIIRAYGTSSQVQESSAYNGAGLLTSHTNGRGATTTYTYDASENRTSEVNADGEESKWTYDATHDVLTATTPDGETTTITRNGHGEPEVVSRPAPGATTQSTHYKYDAYGDLESVEDPLKRVTKYEYDGYGDRSAETDPEGNERTWKYNEDSQLTSTVSPRGNAKGAEAAKFTTTIERDAQGRATLVTEPEARGGAKPDDRTLPSVSGMLWEGQTLTAGTGVWEGSPSLSYTYQWQHCNASGGECANITGATGSTRVLAKGEVGETLRVLVTATNSLGSAVSASPASAVVSAGSPPTGAPVSKTLPAVSGVLLQGQTLSASAGTWSAGPNPTYAYQWQRCNRAGGECANISGATSSTRVLGKTEVAGSVRVVVTATNSGGHASATSPASEAIEGPRTTAYTYDADGNVETVVNPDGEKTKYTYDPDNELTKVEEPNGTVTETGYDGAGQVDSQTNGRKQTTEYVRNPLEEVVEVVDPLKRKTFEEYDAAGNLVAVTDPLKRVTTHAYDAANRLVATTYSDEKTPTATYEYNGDGLPTKMTDGTGTTSYSYDQLDRLTETVNGHKEKAGYEYDLDNEQTKIVYPNGKAVTRSYDKDGRLEKVTDWSEHASKFKYDADSDLTGTVFPSSTGDEDSYTYSEADQMTEAKMLKGTETLASLAYTRDNDGNVMSATQTGLPGEASVNYEYDLDSRLVKAATAPYEYDAANDPTKQGSGSYAYDSDSELETGPSTKYAYNEASQRTTTTPTSGPATGYGYDQAGNLVSVTRPKEGATPAIEDSYAYDGNDLRASQTISGATSYLAWDLAEPLPPLLNDGTNSYIYGPGGTPIEQINNSTGAVTYLHHDQQGSTRLITGSTGKVEGKCSYSAYGTPTCEGSATTPLGWDGQSTSSDTGLVYLRNRVYDPATAQFLTVDPAVAVTRSPYNYGGDNPVNRRDPDGLAAAGIEGVPCYFPFCGPPPPAVEGVQHGIETVEHGIEHVWNAINENEGPNDEGEAELKEKEAQRECGEPNPGSLEKLKQREIDRILDEAGTDAHTDKAETVGRAGREYDYYRDKETGEIYLVPKEGGEAIPTGYGR
jgi:RHS repeat-associated protein